MAEKIISVKSGKVVEKDDKNWVELIDQDDKTHRIFRSIQNNEGNWVHLDKEVDFLKSKIEASEIGGLALKLTKEKKGTFWNVTGVEEVKNVLQKEALQQVTSGREASIEQQVAIKEIGECWRAGKFTDSSPEVRAYQAWILDKLNGYLKGGKDVSNKVSTKETGQLPREEARQGSGDFDEEWWLKALTGLDDKPWVAEQLRLLGVTLKRGQTYVQAIKALDKGKQALLKNGVGLALEYKRKTE